MSNAGELFEFHEAPKSSEVFNVRGVSNTREQFNEVPKIYFQQINILVVPPGGKKEKKTRKKKISDFLYKKLNFLIFYIFCKKKEKWEKRNFPIFYISCRKKGKNGRKSFLHFYQFFVKYKKEEK